MATVEEMIDKIETCVLSRQICIAEYLANEFCNDSSASPFKESGYAILSIIVSYYEMIEQFMCGKNSKDQSAKFFKRGFKKVYPTTPLSDADIAKVYELVRCGMYHEGMAKKETRLSRFFPVGFALKGGEIHLNPGKIVEEIRAHFCGYICALRNPTNADRANFERRCRDLGVDQSGGSTTSSVRTTRAPWEQG